ncbi:MAG: hypothetical protein LBB64_03995, partial [Dysgonamonadaceae bacterium]|nr:hypothetical protein [Dysgonamonadaceae bacterium]
MNKRTKEFSMWRYIPCLSAVIILLFGITFLLSSCEGELLGQGPDSGEKITVNFSLKDASYNDKGSATRSENGTDPEPETAVIPVEGNLCMYVFLEEKPDAGKRSASNLDNGTQVRIVAYRKGETNKTAYADYTVAGGRLIPNDGDLAVEAGEYVFV